MIDHNTFPDMIALWCDLVEPNQQTEVFIISNILENLWSNFLTLGLLAGSD